MAENFKMMISYFFQSMKSKDCKCSHLGTFLKFLCSTSLLGLLAKIKV